jgi:soluble lytic murein transglycosylase-like protein
MMLPLRRTRSRLRAALVGAGTVAASLLCTGVASSADIYQSVDSQGVIVFTNRARKGKLYARVPDPPRRDSAMTFTNVTRFDEHIHRAAILYQIPEELVRAVIHVESGFDPRAVSRTNARGLMQLMPETAARMMVTDVLDPRQNIFGGVRYLRVLANLFNGNIELTLAGYNAGENAVMQYGGIPPYQETRDYVVKVLEYYRYYRDQKKD